MPSLLYRPDPASAEAVWALTPGRKAGLRPRHAALLVLLLIPMMLTATLGTMNFSGPDGTAIASFWPAAAFQIAFSIWFGAIGAIAGAAGPMLGNGLIGDTPLLFVQANAFQSILPGLWFRWWRLDPRLRTPRDWAHLLIVAILLTNAGGAGLGVAESALRHTAPPEAASSGAFWLDKYLDWFVGNSIPCLVLVPLLLKSASGMIVRGPLFCQRFVCGSEIDPDPHPWPRFSRLPMMAKLMLLTVVVGMLPLSLVAAWAVWSTVQQAEMLTSEANRGAAQQIRNEIERHELLLRAWARDLDQPELSPERVSQLLRAWSSVPEGFEALEVVELAELAATMPPAARSALDGVPVAFYAEPAPYEPARERLRGVIRLSLRPGRALTGIVVWRGDATVADRWGSVEAVLVLDHRDREVYRRAPAVLADWSPARRGSAELVATPSTAYTVRHGGHLWHVAESQVPELGWRFATLTSARGGQMKALASVPNPLAALINLSIFGSLIVGSALAWQISGRVLTIADRVQEHGAQPGALRLPEDGEDELGHLARMLNRMSADLENYVRRLEETTAENERLAAEMNLARQVQQSVLPASPPDVPGYELAAACLPAREVGGDFFDFIGSPDGRVMMMVGDAAGKGLRAAMVIMQAHGLAHAAAIDHALPERILRSVNAALAGTGEPTGQFVTMLCAQLEPREHRLVYSSAGHLPPLVIRDGQVRLLDLGSMPLAIEPEVQYAAHEFRLDRGDTVVLYTDGVTEAMNPERSLFHLERLCDAAAGAGGRPAAAVLEAILAAVRAFVGDAPQSDDITLLVARRVP